MKTFANTWKPRLKPDYPRLVFYHRAIQNAFVLSTYYSQGPSLSFSSFAPISVICWCYLTKHQWRVLDRHGNKLRDVQLLHRQAKRKWPWYQIDVTDSYAKYKCGCALLRSNKTAEELVFHRPNETTWRSSMWSNTRKRDTRCFVATLIARIR